MKDYLCTLVAIPDEIIEGSAYQELDIKWPKGACHDGINKLFASVSKLAIDPLLVSSLLPNFVQEYNEEGEAIGPSYIDALVEILGPILYADDRSRHIHIFKSVLSQLYRHPVYQQFIEEHTQEEQPNNINKEP